VNTFFVQYMNRILGVDYGTKRFGFAFGDASTRVVVPLDIVELDGRSGVDVVSKIVLAEDYDGVVVGVPFSADGDMNPQSMRVLQFVDELRDALDVEVGIVSEHLTSRAADMLAETVGACLHDDSLAAKLILDDYFESVLDHDV